MSVRGAMLKPPMKVRQPPPEPEGEPIAERDVKPENVYVRAFREREARREAMAPIIAEFLFDL